jgi:hypothetical protein
VTTRAAPEGENPMTDGSRPRASIPVDELVTMQATILSHGSRKNGARATVGSEGQPASSQHAYRFAANIRAAASSCRQRRGGVERSLAGVATGPVLVRYIAYPLNFFYVATYFASKLCARMFLPKSAW